MPYKSKRQQRWFHAAESRGELPKGTASEWSEHTDFSKLPETAAKQEKTSADRVRAIADRAATHVALLKLSADSHVSPELLTKFAGWVDMTPIAFVKKAYTDPDGFITFLKMANKVPLAAHEKKAFSLGSLPNTFLQKLTSMAGKGAGYATLGAKGVGQAVQKTPGVGPALAAGGVGTLAGGAAGLATRNSSPAPTPEPASTQAPTPEPAPSPAPSQAPSPAPKAAGKMQQGAGAPGNPAQQSATGMSPLAKALMVGGGVGAGALGAGAIIRQRRKKAANDIAGQVHEFLLDLVVKKATDLYRTQATGLMVRHLDYLANRLSSLEKTAAVRAMQVSLVSGEPLSHAIKLAYPVLSGEQRGILASQLVRSALAWNKEAMTSCSQPQIHKRKEWHGKASESQGKIKELS